MIGLVMDPKEDDEFFLYCKLSLTGQWQVVTHQSLPRRWSRGSSRRKVARKRTGSERWMHVLLVIFRLLLSNPRGHNIRHRSGRRHSGWVRTWVRDGKCNLWRCKRLYHENRFAFAHRSVVFTGLKRGSRPTTHTRGCEVSTDRQSTSFLESTAAS